MTRDEIRDAIAQLMFENDWPGVDWGSDIVDRDSWRKVADHVMPDIDEYARAVREEVAQKILTDPSLRPKQFARLMYPAYMQGIDTGMHRAAKIAQDDRARTTESLYER